MIGNKPRKERGNQKSQKQEKKQKHYMVKLDVIAHILFGNRPRQTRHASRWTIGVGVVVVGWRASAFNGRFPFAIE